MLRIFVTLTLCSIVYCLPELAIEELSVTDKCRDHYYGSTFKSMYQGTWLNITINCPSVALEIREVRFRLKILRCYNAWDEYLKFDKDIDEEKCVLRPDREYENYISKYLIVNDALGQSFSCEDKKSISLKLAKEKPQWENADLPTTQTDIVKPETPPVQRLTPIPSEAMKPAVTTAKPSTAWTIVNSNDDQKRRRRRDENNASKVKTTSHLEAATTAATPNRTLGAIQLEEDGLYLFAIMIFTNELKQASNLSFTVNIEPIASHGYLSAVDYPFLPFYAVMLSIYVVYLLVWLILCCYYRKDILRIQFWITAVIFLGFMEKAVYVGEYQTINHTGHPSVEGAIIFGEILSCLKRTVSRILVIIASVGFGIVKPRLGTTMHKVLIVGVIYFILSVFEGSVRVTSVKTEADKPVVITYLALAIIDAAICWWIFTALVNTMRTLRVRRNVVKLSLYRHFTNTLIFSVLASIAFMIWSIKQHKMTECVKDWKELWVDDAVWHVLFSVILFVIMILWRPSANNQRYAYSPLQDADDLESVEPMINTAFSGVTLRYKNQENGSKMKSKDGSDDVEEDLKWIEDNIPTSLADSALPSLLDSDEEVTATRNELRKMH